MARGIVVGAHNVSVRRNPWVTESEDVIKELPNGSTVSVDPASVVYDWKGHKYYAYIESGSRVGYVRSSCIRLRGRRVLDG